MLVEVRRGPFVESRHRGHIVQVDVTGKVERGVGDPDYVTSLRSAVKPFAVTALLEAGGAEQFHLTDQEIAVMSASHTARTRTSARSRPCCAARASRQSLLACGSDGAPADTLTAARLAREGEAPGPIRHMCSGFHTSSLLLSPTFRAGRCPTTGGPSTPARLPPRRGGAHLPRSSQRTWSPPSTTAAC